MNMKRTTRRFWAPGVLVLLLVVPVGTAAAGPSEQAAASVEPVTWFTDPARAVGSSTLVRHDDGVSMRFSTSELLPREAITIWWVVFNNPAGCSTPCGPDDVFVDGDASLGLDQAAIDSADVVAGYGGGRLTNPAGRVTIVGSLEEGATGEGLILGTPPLLKDSRAAEIHLVARTHGPAIPGMVEEQLGSYGGGCTAFLLPGTYPTGVGGCADIQSSTHLP